MTPALLTLAASLVLTPLVRALARRRGIVAAPRAERWHRTATPLLGGVAIAGALALGLGAAWSPGVAPALPVLAAAAVLFLGGLVDDLRGLAPSATLGVQLFAATLVLAGGLHLPWTPVPVLDGALTLLWLVGITNAVNLLDNMDGLAAGLTVVIAAGLAALLLMGGDAGLALVPVLLGTAAAGFLAYNAQPASIFMGNAGSMLLGAALAGTALLAAQGGPRNVLVPVLLMAVPILDTTLVTITRLSAGRRVWEGGRDHASHRLVALGLSERAAVALLWALAAVGVATALVVSRVGPLAAPALAAPFALGVLVLGIVLASLDVDPPYRDAG